MRAKKSLAISTISLLVTLLFSGCGDSSSARSTQGDKDSDRESESESDNDTADTTDTGTDTDRGPETDDTDGESDTETYSDSDPEDTETECSGGPCCDDNGFFRGPLDVACGTIEEHRCAPGVCGAGPEFRTVLIFCSGTSAECNGDTSDPQWAPFASCQTGQICELDRHGLPQCSPCAEPKICQAGTCDCEFEPCLDGCCAEGQVCGWTETCRMGESKLLPFDRVVNWFGRAVSLSGDTAMIGASASVSSETPAGAVFHFERDTSGSWKRKAILAPRIGSAGDNFGVSVAVSGDFAIIGASGDDDIESSSGAAYIFERSTSGDWVQKAKLLPDDGASGDEFGWSVSISGTVAIIGACSDDDNGSASGAAYIFERSTSGDWEQKAKLLPADGAAYESFGDSVGISGNKAVVGAQEHSNRFLYSGGAYIFERGASGKWVQKAKLVTSDEAEEDYLGESVSISGNIAVVGADHNDDYGNQSGAAYIFERSDSGDWVEKAKLLPSDGAPADLFGHSVSISGYMAVIGAFHNGVQGIASGSAYVFERSDSGDWVEKAKLLPSKGAERDEFGYALSISGDVVLIGAIGDKECGSNAGAAYIL